jgi:hypothetical protein
MYPIPPKEYGGIADAKKSLNMVKKSPARGGAIKR